MDNSKKVSSSLSDIHNAILGDDYCTLAIEASEQEIPGYDDAVRSTFALLGEEVPGKVNYTPEFIGNAAELLPKAEAFPKPVLFGQEMHSDLLAELKAAWTVKESEPQVMHLGPEDCRTTLEQALVEYLQAAKKLEDCMEATYQKIASDNSNYDGAIEAELDLLCDAGSVNTECIMKNLMQYHRARNARRVDVELLVALTEHGSHVHSNSEDMRALHAAVTSGRKHD